LNFGLKSSLVALQKQIKREKNRLFFFGESQFGNRFAIIQRKTHRWISLDLFLFPSILQVQITGCAPLKIPLSTVLVYDDGIKSFAAIIK
jgi:hypothetical protein